MARFDKLLASYLTVTNFRNVVTKRILAVPLQQAALFSTAPKDKLKNIKIPEQPKRPLPPYIKFINEHRLKVKNEHPDWSMIAITKQCAQDWKVVDSAFKEKLSSEFHRELEVYMQKRQVYNEALTLEQVGAIKDAKAAEKASKERRAIRKLIREANKPKRPIASFIYYMKEKMALSENKGKKYLDIIKLYKDEWNALPEDKKKPYSILYDKDKVRYDNEMKTWETKMIKQGNEDLIRKSSKVITTKAVSIPKAKREA